MDWANISMELFGGLAIFLFGLEQLTVFMKAVAGPRLKSLLAKLTSNRFVGVLTGAGITAVVQSSSVTTVLVVGFISAGLMSLSQSVGVIMGANIGTTVTAQIIAFKITKAALLILALGFSAWFFPKNERVRNWGGVLMALGLIFLGMNIMGEGMRPLRTYQPFINLMVDMENPLLGILVAAAFTGLIQSSSATTGIIIAMASQGILSLPAGITLTFGANIGTCATAMLAAVGKSREAQRAAAVHVIFNVLGVLLWVGFVDKLAVLVTAISPSHPELDGVKRVAAEVPRQIANAHTVFNVSNTVVLIWFSSLIARVAEKLVPDLPIEAAHERRNAQRLPEALLTTPSVALDVVRRELPGLGDEIGKMLAEILPAIYSGDRARIEAVGARDDFVDEQYSELVTYLGKLSTRSLSTSESSELSHLLAVANDLESMGDVVETNLVTVGLKLADAGVEVSAETQGVLNRLQEEVLKALQLATSAVVEQDQDAAREVIDMKTDVWELANQAELHESSRLGADEPNRLAAYTSEVEIVARLRRIYYHAKRMAKTVA